MFLTTQTASNSSLTLYLAPAAGDELDTLQPKLAGVAVKVGARVTGMRVLVAVGSGVLVASGVAVAAAVGTRVAVAVFVGWARAVPVNWAAMVSTAWVAAASIVDWITSGSGVGGICGPNALHALRISIKAKTADRLTNLNFRIFGVLLLGVLP